MAHRWRLAGLAVLAAAGRAVATCPATRQMLPKPQFATEYNGAAWPEGCVDKAEAHFFVIGDWGGTEFYGRVNPFRWKKRKTINAIDKKPQQLVAERMKEEAPKARPEFVINVGDNFYPAGVKFRCNSLFPWEQARTSKQFRYLFELMYAGRGLDGKEWLGVLGNHDYGGHKYDMGWVHSIYYSWEGDRWLTPAQYYSRRYKFNGFAADFYFLDSNVINAYPPPASHSMCSKKHSGYDCTRNNPTGPSDPSSCFKYFHKLWADQLRWLESKLAASTSQWQILVMHHPPEALADVLVPICQRWGVDLILSGHRHSQEVHYNEAPFGSTAVVISGGGGGIWSENLPSLKGVDSTYGFINVKISAGELLLMAHTHGGEQGARIIKSTTKVVPRPRGAVYFAVNGTASSSIDASSVV